MPMKLSRLASICRQDFHHTLCTVRQYSFALKQPSMSYCSGPSTFVNFCHSRPYVEPMSDANKSIIDHALKSHQFALPAELSIQQIEAMMRDIVTRDVDHLYQLHKVGIVERLIRMTLTKQAWIKSDFGDYQYMSILRSWICYKDRLQINLNDGFFASYIFNLLINPQLISSKNFEHIVRLMYLQSMNGTFKVANKKLEQAILVFVLRRINVFCSLSYPSDVTVLFWRLFSKDALHITPPNGQALERICGAVSNDLLFKSKSDDEKYMFISSVTKAAMLFVTFGTDRINSQRCNENWWNVWINCWTGIDVDAVKQANFRNAVLYRFLLMCTTFDRMDTFDEHRDLWFSRLNASLQSIPERAWIRFKENVDDLLNEAPAFQARYAGQIQSAFQKASIDPKKTLTTSRFAMYRSENLDTANRYFKNISGNEANDFKATKLSGPTIFAIFDLAVDLPDADLKNFFTNHVATVVESWLQFLESTQKVRHFYSSDLVQTLHRIRMINERSGGEVLQRINFTDLNRIIQFYLNQKENLLCEEIEVLMKSLASFKEQDPRIDFEHRSLLKLCSLCSTVSQVQCASSDSADLNFRCVLLRKSVLALDKPKVDQLFSHFMKSKTDNVRTQQISWMKMAKLLLESDRADVPLDDLASEFVSMYQMRDSSFCLLTSAASENVKLFLEMCLKFNRVDLIRNHIDNIQTALSNYEFIAAQEKKLLFDRCRRAISEL